MGLANRCGLQIYNISDPTYPRYIGGIDLSGASNSGTGAGSYMYAPFVSGSHLFIGRSSDSTACSSVPGSAVGCEIQIFDIGGFEATSVVANSLEAGQVSITGNANINSNLSVNGGLNVGGGIHSDGNVGINGYLTFNLATAGTTNDAVCWDNSGSSLLYDCDGTPADYAEIYPVTPTLFYGEIVSTTEEMVTTTIGTNVPRLAKATASENAKILGITSDNWHDFTSAGKDEINQSDNPMPVALNGRVITKVSTESGKIKIGDPITASSVPGVGMKAVEAGRVVGTALENFDGNIGTSSAQLAKFLYL